MGGIMSVLNVVLKPISKLAGKILTNGMFASAELAKARVGACNSCPHLFEPTRNCKKCLCFVDEKTKYQDQKCPIGRW